MIFFYKLLFDLSTEHVDKKINIKNKLLNKEPESSDVDYHIFRVECQNYSKPEIQPNSVEPNSVQPSSTDFNRLQI